MPKVDAYEPNLLCMGVITAPLERACNAMQFQLERTIGREEFSSKLQNINWLEFFKGDGRSYEIKRAEIALFSSREGITVYVCNLADGWVSLYENLVKAASFNAYFFRATLAEQAEYKVYEMIAWRHAARVRHLRALQEEDGWGFLNRGDPLPFEDVKHYKKRKVSSRLNRGLIESYSEAAGYKISSVTEFEGRCWQFWRSG